MSNLWSGRFAGEPDKDVFAFGRSFPFDKRLVEDDITGSLAWAEALAARGRAAAATSTPPSTAACRRCSTRVGAIPPRSPATMRTCTRGSSASWWRWSATPASACTPGARATSRSRSICGSTCVGASPVVERELVRLVGALVAQAEGAGDALMPAYTHLRRAQPVLAAHYWLSHAAAFRRDADALCRGVARSRRAAARLRRDCRQLLRASTSSASPRVSASRASCANSMDAVADRDFVSTFLHAVRAVRWCTSAGWPRT